MSERGGRVWHFDWDWKKRDAAAYQRVMMHRARTIQNFREHPVRWAALRCYYRDHIAQFIHDWGMTYDPRNPEVDMPAAVPFLLFDKQVEAVDWMIDHWRRRRSGIIEKSRDQGMSWLAVAVGASMSIFHPGFSAGYGSRKEEYVDKIGDFKSLFVKARFFVENLPAEFRGGCDTRRDAPFKRVLFPAVGSAMTGEGGDSIGRGDRQSMYLVDESAHLEHAAMIDAALSATTNCRLDFSSVNGMANPFAQKRHSGNIDVFTMHWRDNPMQDQAWYDAKCLEINDPVVVAQELDINYSASVEGVLIPSAWVQAAIDATEVLGIELTGRTTGSMDVADEGRDKNAFAVRKGIGLLDLEEWSGIGSDIYKSVVKVINRCDDFELDEFIYDADGLGAGVRGDANNINTERAANSLHAVTPVPFWGSGGVIKPDAEMVKKRKNKDYFANLKAQSWWALRIRFQLTFRVMESIKEGNPVSYDPDDLISIPKSLPNRARLVTELSQPTFTVNNAGKLLVDKAPDGTRSPNLADAVMICYAPIRMPLRITAELLQGA